MEEEHNIKYQNAKTEVQDIRKLFETRCAEFKKQVDDFKKNNEAMEALKKAHQKEIAEHVQTSNKKYNDLLTDKLNMEDSMKAQHKQDIAALNKEWHESDMRVLCYK